MGDVKAKLARERVPKCSGMPFRCLDADKDFAVLKREDVGGPPLMQKFAMQKSHSTIRNQPDENLIQFLQVGVLLLMELQTAAHRFRGECLEFGNINTDFSLEISQENFRGCHSGRSQGSLVVSAGQSKRIIAIFRPAQPDVNYAGGLCSD